MAIAAFIIISIALVWLFWAGKRKTVVRNDQPVPTNNFGQILNEHVDYYRHLDDDGKARFEEKVKEFLADTNIEGVGMEVSDIDRVLVAGSAVIPIFGFPEWRYRNLTNVIIYPDTFNGDFEFEGESRNIMGMVGSGYMNGQMLLSHAALVRGFSKNNGKENTAIHEFVHLLDKADGTADGVPNVLIDHEYVVPWLQMMHKEMHRIREGKSDINPYALTNEAEFLAVAAEYFFEKPEQMKDKHPEIYQELSLMFSQQPAG